MPAPSPLKPLLAARFKTMGASRATNTILRLLPLIGRQPSLIHHLEQAAIKAKNYDGFIKGVVNEAKSSELASPLKRELVKFATELSKAKNSDLASPKSANSVATSLKDDKLKGANWVSKTSSEPVSDYKITSQLDENTARNMGLDDTRIMADLATLADKHPELFSKPSDAFRLMMEVKTNPNHFYKNNKLNAALIAKDLKDGKLGKMAVINQGENSGEVVHLTKSSNATKEKERLNRRNKKLLAEKTSLVEAPHSTLSIADTAGAQSAFKEIENSISQARLNSAETPAQKAKNEINRQNRARLKAGKPELTPKQKQNITKEIFSQAQKPKTAIKGDKLSYAKYMVDLKTRFKTDKIGVANELITTLKSAPSAQLPDDLSPSELKAVMGLFENKTRLTDHLLASSTKKDDRFGLFKLTKITQKEPQIHFIADKKDKYIKKFKGEGKEPFIYLLVTKDNGKIFITHLKTRDFSNIKNGLIKADDIVKVAI